VQAKLLTLVGLFIAFASIGTRTADNPVGSWTSEGYGLFFHIDPSRIVASEITSISCLPAWNAGRIANQGDAWVFQGGFASGDEIIRIYPGANANMAILRRSDDMAAMALHRVSSPPPPCKRPVKDTPIANYDVLWTTFAENYPFFELHGVDWDAVDRQFRPLVGSKTTPNELFSIFRQMLAPLRDSHVVLDVFPPGTPRGKDWLKTPLREVWLHKPDPEPFEDADFDRANEIIEFRYIDGKVQTFCRGQIRFGLMRGGQVGYLGVLSFHQYTTDDDLPAGLACIRAAGDVIFVKTRDVKGLVIDVRSNSGGEDAFVLELASRLTDRRYLAFGKRVRITSEKKVRFTSRHPIFVEPSRGPRYLGEAVLLAGRYSASAAETFTMALMGRQPEICRIGENTQGVFSDVLDRRLPNGWRLVLPNEIYVTAGGKSFDVAGVPPDVAVAGFSRKDFGSERDPALEKALALLASD
jgi:peptidase S41-like protein/tricorn protease-like protein